VNAQEGSPRQDAAAPQSNVADRPSMGRPSDGFSRQDDFARNPRKPVEYSDEAIMSGLEDFNAKDRREQRQSGAAEYDPVLKELLERTAESDARRLAPDRFNPVTRAIVKTCGCAP